MAFDPAGLLHRIVKLISCLYLEKFGMTALIIV